MNEEYWRLRALNVALNILKGQENGTITRTEIDDMNRNIQITKLCYNDGYNEGFQKGKLEERERIRDSIIEVKNSYEIKSRYGEKAVINICAYLEEQLQKEIGGMKE